MGRKVLLDNQINEIRRLRREGFSYSMIAKELQLSRTTACKYSQDILFPGQPKRFKSDSISIILSNLMNIFKQLLDVVNVLPDEVDAVLKRCREKLDNYDTETLFVLQSSTKGYFNFINNILDEVGLIEKYRFTIGNPETSLDSTKNAPCTDEGKQNPENTDTVD